jgi:tetratricopeptide (TPR) repeat protein
LKHLDHLRWLALPGVLLLLAAAPDADPYHLVRRGNAAFGAGRFDEARGLYERAQERITDPGLAAFNAAVALYQLTDYREAERQFQCCLADAVGLRRARALFGLGNCLLLQGDRNTERLREAVRAFGECLQEGEVDAALTSDARQNLELAKLLLARADGQPPKANPPEPQSSRNGADRRPRPKQLPDRGLGQKPQGAEKPDPRQPGTAVKPEHGPEPTPTNERPPPGAGNLEPIPDRAELTSLASPDAERHLDAAVDRITRERRAYRFRLPRGPGSAVLDW